MHFEQKPWNLCINICTLKLELKNKGQENTENMKLDRIMFWIWITNQYLKNGYPYKMILYCGNRSLFLNNSYMANVNVTEDPSTIFKFPLFFFFGGGGFVGIFKLSIFLHSIRSICHISGPNRPFSLNKSYMANVNLQRIQVQFSSFLFFNFFLRQNI